MTKSGHSASATRKRVYLFGGGKADGTAQMKELLGGKGANLAEMASLGLPVPPGFTITTEVCTAYYAEGRKLLAASSTTSRLRLPTSARPSAQHSAMHVHRCWSRCAQARARRCRA